MYHNDRATTKKDTKWVEGRDLWWHETVAAFPKECEVEWVDADHPLFLLYTSGSTGEEKGRLELFCVKAVVPWLLQGPKLCNSLSHVKKLCHRCHCSIRQWMCIHGAQHAWRWSSGLQGTAPGWCIESAFMPLQQGVEN